MEPKFIMMVGLVSSGKSYKAEQLAKEYDATVFSSDKLREELYGDVNDQSHNQELFVELHRHIKECLRSGKSAIFDATNISYKRRMAFLKELKNIPCEKICVLMATPYEECLKRNAERERKVPESVIKRMYMNFNVPYWYEGWDDIQVEYSGFRGYYGKPFDFYKKYKDYNQNNSHHTLSLGEHCRMTAVRLVSNYAHGMLVYAGYLHDCAKSQVATFINSKGVKTSECHYYNHQYTSAYNSLFYNCGDHNPIDIAVIVMWHMRPYMAWKQSEKARERDRRLLGEKLYNDIWWLHEADVTAH